MKARYDKLTPLQAERAIEKLVEDPEIRDRTQYEEWKKLYTAISEAAAPSAIYFQPLEGATRRIKEAIRSARDQVTIFSGTMNVGVFTPASNLPALLRKAFLTDRKKLLVFAGPNVMDTDCNPLYEFLQEAHTYGDNNVCFRRARKRLPLHGTVTDRDCFFFEGPHTEDMDVRINFVYAGGRAHKALEILEESYISRLLRTCPRMSIGDFENVEMTQVPYSRRKVDGEYSISAIQAYLGKGNALQVFRKGRREQQRS